MNLILFFRSMHNLQYAVIERKNRPLLRHREIMEKCEYCWSWSKVQLETNLDVLMVWHLSSCLLMLQNQINYIMSQTTQTQSFPTLSILVHYYCHVLICASHVLHTNSSSRILFIGPTHRECEPHWSNWIGLQKRHLQSSCQPVTVGFEWRICWDPAERT